MTLRQWIDWLAGESIWAGAYLLALPALALLLGLALPRGKGNEGPWKYLYSALVYGACVPGMFAATLTLYLMLFVGQNLLDVNALVTFGPLVSMALTLAIASRTVEFRPLPGFGRLSGLMTVLGLTFGLLFALSRTRLWIVFGGSIFLLIGIAAFVFALIRWGAHMAFRRSDEPELPPPRFDA